MWCWCRRYNSFDSFLNSDLISKNVNASCTKDEFYKFYGYYCRIMNITRLREGKEMYHSLKRNGIRNRDGYLYGISINS